MEKLEHLLCLFQTEWIMITYSHYDHNEIRMGYIHFLYDMDPLSVNITTSFIALGQRPEQILVLGDSWI
jgi:hypothetical protein